MSAAVATTAERSGRDQIAIISAADHAGPQQKPLDWRISRRIVREMWKYRPLFIGILALASLLAVINGALPHLAGLVIAGPVIEGAVFEERWGIDAITGIWLGAAGVAVLAGLWMLVMRYRFIAVALMAERVAHDLRAQLFRHLQWLSIDFYDHTKVGWIIARGGSDIDQVRSAVSQVIPRMLIAAVQMLYATIAIALYDWVMLLILLGITPIVYVLNAYFRRRLSHAHREVRASFSRLTANLAESVAGVRVTQAFVREEKNARIFRDLCIQHRNNHLREARAHGVYVPTLDFAGQVFIVLALLAGGWRVSEGAMTVGALIGVMLMTRPFFQPITVIGEMYNVTLQAMAGGERVFNLLDTRPTIREPDDPIALPQGGGASVIPAQAGTQQPLAARRGARVEFDRVTFGYLPNRPVLEDVSFVAEPGQTVALVGHTGAGKTTVVALIAKFYEVPTLSPAFEGGDQGVGATLGAHDALHPHPGPPPRRGGGSSGEIRIDGIPMSRIHSDDLHRHTGMVQQQSFLFHGSVMENIRFVRPEASDEEVREVCRRLGCLDILEALPQGFATDAGERGEALSQGQRQLVTFARAMLADPRILLLDEATSAVDAVTEYRVQRALDRLLEGRTSFVVAHRLSTVRRADQVLVLERGRIVERGTHDGLVAKGGAYASLYEEFVRLSTGA
jgi:ATP-binding cassette subfamily B protein